MKRQPDHLDEMIRLWIDMQEVKTELEETVKEEKKESLKQMLQEIIEEMVQHRQGSR